MAKLAELKEERTALRAAKIKFIQNGLVQEYGSKSGSAKRISLKELNDELQRVESMIADFERPSTFTADFSEGL